ncbi:uncharacterized protein LOC116105351 [Pistacia vera]|uniref:uncharacterized protein LOC116105351 n=1 Tax=Pistacia vera TaxID=55513 RepID=UPI001263E43D|nr:uncharacterized protein LOC116105351 [Pistacia vera]
MKSHTPNTVHLLKNISAVDSNCLPPKLKDPGAPIISYVIGNVMIDRALLDLGTSVNLLPISVYEQFNLGELKSTEVILQLADRSVKMPGGLIEVVKVEELYFSVDFLVLNMEYTSSGSIPPIILERPFLTTANACINCRSGEMEVSFRNMKLRLNVFNAGLGPMHEDDNEFFMIDAIGSLVEAYAPQMLCDDTIYTLVNPFVEEICSLSVMSEIQEVSAYMDRSPTLERRPWNIKYEPLPPLSKTTHPRSIESPLVFELKALPNTLKYVSLGPNKTLPMIIAANLDSEQEERLVAVLTTHKEAIGWSVADSQGISPSLHMYHIFCEENAKRVHEAQRRLNSNIKEEVKKEVIKWLDAIFMDEFSVFGTSFDNYLKKLELVLKRCKETNLILSWEKRHFMVQEGIVLGHVVFKKGIAVDNAKVELISQLPPPSSVKQIRSFLGHTGFYRCFIQNFSKIFKPLCDLLAKDVTFVFYDSCMIAFTILKQALTTAPIMQPLDWNLPFEVMCDTLDYAIGAVLDQWVNKKPVVIYYASKTFSNAQCNYTTTEKELLVVMFSIDKSWFYLLGSRIVVFITLQLGIC